MKLSVVIVNYNVKYYFGAMFTFVETCAKGYLR